MMRPGGTTRVALLFNLLGAVAAPVAAQGPPSPWAASFAGAASAPGSGPARLQESPPADDGGLTFLGTAKWASLAVSAGAAVYGFSLNSQADDLFAELDGLCTEDSGRCDSRNPDGSFQDAGLEGLYQRTLSKDRQARAALIVSQATLAAAVLFFIMDLSNTSPPNIPFDPSTTFEAGPAAGGGVFLGGRVRFGPGHRPSGEGGRP